ncbi:MAG: hypothetical protein ACQGVC_05080 [Myxococcota bacterium]
MQDEVLVLGRLFREHAAWRAAARYVSAPDATSDVYFTTRPGEAWHLALRGDHAELLPGRSADPDFVFRFAPGAVRRLAEEHDGLAGFAMALFRAMESADPEEHVDLRVVAGFGRLVRRGYVKLVAAAGPRLLVFAAERGLRGLPALKRLVDGARRARPYDWEVPE